MSSLEEELAGYSEFWRSKILRNVERDTEVNRTLKAQGWAVIRIWESDIRSNLDECVRIVKETLFEAKIEQGE